MMKKASLFILLISIAGSLFAQTPQEAYGAWKRQAQGHYGRYRQQALEDYQAFRKRANEEYAEFVKTAWERVGRKPAMEPPQEPKPPQPPVAPEEKPAPEAIPHEAVAPTPEPRPVPEVPMPPTTPTGNTKEVVYYGTTLSVHVPKGEGLSLKGVDGESLSAAWTALSDGSYDALLADCLNAKKLLGLGDWGYITLLEKVAKSISEGNVSQSERKANELAFPNQRNVSVANEAVFLQQWLLTQSGYHARMAISGEETLQIWMPFDVLVYNLPFIELDEGLYFLVTEMDQEGEELRVLNKAFPGENLSSLRIVGIPRLEYKACGNRRLRSEKYPSITLQSEVNSNLIAYYNDYPKVAGSWDVYAAASLSDKAKNLLYPKLRTLLQGKDEQEKAEMLLNWVQTAFQYKTDEDQFGGERSLFADETLYYPYCDCEDRSILLSILIHDLMGLDVVLLHFPGHLATAVKFSTHVEGDYLDLEDGTYIVCDPTYINAPVGMAMPDCKEQEVTVFRILRRQ